jgi:hypothetical protein
MTGFWPTACLFLVFLQAGDAPPAPGEIFNAKEQEFQDYQTWPGVKSKTVSPPRVLDAR